jgi:two-component system sensor histidine kinase PhoQ
LSKVGVAVHPALALFMPIRQSAARDVNPKCTGGPLTVRSAMRSLNARVTLGAALVLAVFLLLSALALERAFRDSARSARQERLLAQVYLLMAAAEVDAHGKLTLGSGPSEPRLDQPGSGLYAVITDGGSDVVWQSRSTLSVDAPHGAPLAAGVQRFEETDDGAFFLQSFGVSWATAGGSFPFTFNVAEDLTAYREQLAVYRRALGTWLGVMALLLLGAQWAILRWGLRPLRHVAEELTRLERGEQERIAGNYPSEVQRLTENLNALLAHERAQQKRYRDALADLAHSLKTPLALVRAALKETGRSDAQTRALDEQVEQMDRIVGYQLQRASTAGRGGLRAPLPVRPAVERLLAALGKVHAARPIATEIAADPSVRFRGDEGDLTELLGNLLDNAFKWARSRVRVTATAGSGALTLCIEDDGPGIAPEHAQHVLERGVRADQSVPGQGIGLAVVRDIVEAYGGEVRIERSDLGGARVSLVLPAR